MNSTKYCAIVMIVLAINIGFLSESLMAQGFSGSGHSGSCAGGCNHGGGDSYSQPGQASLRRSYQSQRMPPSYGHRDAMGGGSSYAQSYQSGGPYRAAYQGSFNSPNDRGGRENYQMRREDFTYANGPAAGS